uniref:Uncharacterized protein n=1 Tax=Glossina palpalis gambiensis TaxID=67801 RepID=A0A1B0B4V3_9MUSC
MAKGSFIPTNDVVEGWLHEVKHNIISKVEYGVSSLEFPKKSTTIMPVHVNGNHCCVAIINQITTVIEFYDLFQTDYGYSFFENFKTKFIHKH